MIIKTQSLIFEHSFGSNRKSKKGVLCGPKLSDENTPVNKSRSFIGLPSVSEEKAYGTSSIITPCEIDIRQL